MIDLVPETCASCRSPHVYYLCRRGVLKKFCALHFHVETKPPCCTLIVYSSQKTEVLPKIKSQFCTMCDGDYTELSTTHRYQTCPYFNGCYKCGRQSARADHVSKCKGPTASFMANICSLCLEKYKGSYSEHRDRECSYYAGCPICKKVYFENGHLKKCREQAQSRNQLATALDRIQYACPVCLEMVDFSAYNAHVGECRKKNIAVIVSDAMASRNQKKEREAPRPDMTRCFLCDVDIQDRYFENHLINCRKQVKDRFSRVGRPTPVDEPTVVDDREKPGEKVVKFKVMEDP